MNAPAVKYVTSKRLLEEELVRIFEQLGGTVPRATPAEQGKLVASMLMIGLSVYPDHTPMRGPDNMPVPDEEPTIEFKF